MCICNLFAQSGELRYLRCRLYSTKPVNSNFYIEYEGNGYGGRVMIRTGMDIDIPFPNGINWVQLRNEEHLKESGYFAIEVRNLNAGEVHRTEWITGKDDNSLQVEYWLLPVETYKTKLGTHKEGDYFCDGTDIDFVPPLYDSNLELQTSVNKYKPFRDLPIVQIAKNETENWTDINSNRVSIGSNSIRISYDNIKTIIGENNFFNEAYKIRLKYQYYNSSGQGKIYDLYSNSMPFVYYHRATYPDANSEPTLTNNVLKLALGEEHQLSIYSKDCDKTYLMNTFPPNKELDLDEGIYQIVLSNKTTNPECKDIRYAVVFSAEHNRVDKNANDESDKDFWSKQQATNGREGAIVLKTNPSPIKSEGNVGSDFDFIIPHIINISESGTASETIEIMTDDSGFPIPNPKEPPSFSIEERILTHSLPKEFCKGSKLGVEHTITITPAGCIPQTIKYTLKGYYDNISIEENDYSYFACNQDDNDGGGLLTINNIRGGKGGGYILVETNAENNETKTTEISANKPILIKGNVRIRDKVEDDYYKDGCTDRQSNPLVLKQTSNIPKINLEPTPVTCHDESTGSVTVSIDIDNIFADQWGIDPGKDINPQITEDNKIFFSDLSAGEYTVSCTIQNNCYIVDTTVTIAQPDIPIEFKLKSTPTTCEDSGDGLITVSSISIQKNEEEEEEKEKFTTLIYYATEEQSKNLNTLQYNLFYKENQQSESHQFNDNDEPTPFENKSYYVYTTVKANETNECSSSEKIVKINSENPQKTLILLPTAASCEAAKNGILSYDTIGRFKPTKVDYISTLETSPTINDELKLINYQFGVGTYNIGLIDGKGCRFDSSFTIVSNTYTFSSSTENASCAAAPNGSAEISATISTTEGNKQGEFNPTCYSWTLQKNQSNKNITEHTSTTNTISGLLPGIYKVEINHDENCTSSTEVVIGTNTYNFQGTQYHDLSCVDASNGDITAQINKSGNGDFNIKGYKWHVKPHGSFNNSSQDKNIFYLSGINEGEYTLEINHDNYCTESTTVNISVNDYEWSTNHLYLSCEEVKNGYISATINRKDDFNGVFKINKYSWTVNDKPYKSGENPANEKDGTYSFELTDLDSGLYHLSLTHDEKCTESTTVKIDVNDYYHDVTTTNAPCAEIPSATATAVTEILSGTEGSFKPIYTWTVKNSKPEPTGSVNTISNRFFGDYNVKIEWANGCSESIDFTIQHDTLKPSLLTTNAECSDKESVGGKAVLNISTPDKRTYSYSWDTQEDNNNIKENLPAGSHNVTVIDNHGCHLDVPFTILNANFSADVKTENALCRQDATGKVTFDIKGGRGMYTINWNGNSNLSQKNISTGIFTQENIPVGIYHVDIKDETNCVVSHKVTISSGNLKVSHKESDASCASIGNAQAEITVSGAKLPVTYKWSDNVETSEPLRSNLSKGNYVVTVVDQNDCSMPVDINIYSKKLSTATAIDSATCGLAPDGAADIKLFSATFPATFSWPDGKTTTDGKRSGLDKGNYDVLITDANGCEVHADIFIPHKGYLQNDVPSNINLCANGEITVDANEFDGYQWVFNGRNVDNNRFYTIKSPGTYIVKANGYDDCYAVDTIAVSMSSKSFSPYFRMSSVSYINDTLVVMEMSQTNPDKYSWKYDTLAFDLDNTKGSDRELRLIPKISGIYSITLSAENEDCVSDISKPVEIFATTRPDDDLSPLYVDNSIVKEFTISPNPTKGPITVEVNLSQIADVRLTIYDLNFGKIRKQVTLHNSDNYKLDINDVLYTGAYVVILQAGNETKQIKYIVGR